MLAKAVQHNRSHIFVIRNPINHNPHDSVRCKVTSWFCPKRFSTALNIRANMRIPEQTNMMSVAERNPALTLPYVSILDESWGSAYLIPQWMSTLYGLLLNIHFQGIVCGVEGYSLFAGISSRSELLCTNKYGQFLFLRMARLRPGSKPATVRVFVCIYLLTLRTECDPSSILSLTALEILHPEHHSALKHPIAIPEKPNSARRNVIAHCGEAKAVKLSRRPDMTSL